MKDQYSVSEVARLFGISTQTLRYYDKIGLFKPDTVDPKTGYRFYQHGQFFSLSMILQLKQLDFSLDRIRNYGTGKDIDRLEKNLVEQRKRILQKQEELRILEQRNDRLLQKLKISKGLEGEPSCEICREPDRFQYEVQMNFKIRDLYQYMKVMYESYMNSPLSETMTAHHEIVLKIFSENLHKEKFRVYNSIGFFISPPKGYRERGIVKIPGGRYASCLHTGPYDTIHKTYQKLYHYIKKKKLIICGDSIEFAFISIALTENPEQFITQIQIPVQ